MTNITSNNIPRRLRLANIQSAQALTAAITTGRNNSGARSMLTGPVRDSVVGTGSGASGSPPVINAQRIVTTVAGRLGEWINLGTLRNDDRRDERGLLSSTSASREDRRQVWVRVEALP